MPIAKSEKTIHRRCPITLDRQMEKNLVAYEKAARTVSANRCLTASAPLLAIGVSMFALPQVTLAEVVCTSVNKSVRGDRGHLMLDLNNDGIQDVSVSAYSTFIIGSGGNFFRSDYLGAHGLMAGNGIVVNNQRSAFAIREGKEFGSSADFSKSGLMARHFSNLYSSSSKGQWKNIKSRRFLGVKFSIAGETHFGWIRFSSSSTSRFGGTSATVTGYAYETLPNEPIIAGMCSGESAPSEPSMEAAPGSLGRLATGARQTPPQ